MRQGQQHRRGRGRNNNNSGHSGGHGGHSSHGQQRKGQNPLTRSFESNGPDVKVRGTPAHVAEKYQQLARDAQSSGDHVLAENYLQHAEHYNRIIFAYREQLQQQSGEQMNGSGRPHMGRQSGIDGDEQGGDDMPGHDDGGSQFDQPMIVRNPMAEQPRGSDMHPAHDDIRPQRQHDHHPRFRDRHQRHDRPDRPERSDRQDGYDRPERGFDRHRERPFQDRSGEQPGEMREAREPREPREMREHREPREPREPREMREHREPREPREPREMREHREPREPREPREMREHREPREPREPRVIPREPGMIDAVPPAVTPDSGPAPARAEGAPRRRERFGLAPEHPDFLRRPVRRPRREPEPGFTAEAPVAPPPVDETPRE